MTSLLYHIFVGLVPAHDCSLFRTLIVLCCLLTVVLVYRIGRRWPLCLFHVFGGLVCIAAPFIPRTTGTICDIDLFTTAVLTDNSFTPDF